MNVGSVQSYSGYTAKNEYVSHPNFKADVKATKAFTKLMEEKGVVAEAAEKLLNAVKEGLQDVPCRKPVWLAYDEVTKELVVKVCEKEPLDITRIVQQNSTNTKTLFDKNEAIRNSQEKLRTDFSYFVPNYYNNHLIGKNTQLLIGIIKQALQYV